MLLFHLIWGPPTNKQWTKNNKKRPETQILVLLCIFKQALYLFHISVSYSVVKIMSFLFIEEDF